MDILPAAPADQSGQENAKARMLEAVARAESEHKARMKSALALATLYAERPDVIESRTDKPWLNVVGDAAVDGAYDLAKIPTALLALPEGLARDAARLAGSDYAPPVWSPLGQLQERNAEEQANASRDAVAYKDPTIARELVGAAVRAAPSAAFQVGLAPVTAAGTVLQVGSKLVPAEIAAMRQAMLTGGAMAGAQKVGDALGSGDGAVRALARGSTEGFLEGLSMKLAPGGLEKLIRGSGARTPAQVVTSLLASIGEEMPEEGFAGATQEVADQLFTDGALDYGKVAKAGLTGMAVGGILAGGMHAPRAIQEALEDRSALRRVMRDGEAADQQAMDLESTPVGRSPTDPVPVERLMQQTQQDPIVQAGMTPVAQASAEMDAPVAPMDPAAYDPEATANRAQQDAAVAPDRADFNAFLTEQQTTPEQFRQNVEQTSDLVEQPADEGVRVGPSAIEGQGVLVQGGATKGQPMATAFDAQGKRTPTGRYMNHAAKPNSTLKQEADGRIVVVPNRDLSDGEEVTVNYRQARQEMQKKAKAQKSPKGAKATPAAQPQQTGDWAAFDPQETLGVPRSSMPQVAAADRPELMDWLKSQGIRSNTETVEPGTLKPTQAEYAPSKVQKAVAETAKAKAAGQAPRPIIVSSDGYVIDGHHQWLAAKASGEPIGVIRVSAPAAQALQTIKRFPKVRQSGGAEGPATTRQTPRQDANAPVPVAGQQPAAAKSNYPGETDKSAAITRAEASGSMPKPIDLGSSTTNESMKSLAKRIMDWAAENIIGKAFTHKATGWKILVTKSGIQHAKGTAAFPGDLLLTKHLPELLEKSVVVGAEPDKNGNPDVVRVFKLAAPVTIDGQRRYAWITVKEYSDKAKRHYNHELVKIEMPGAMTSTPGTSDRAAVGTDVPAAGGELASLNAPSAESVQNGGRDQAPAEPASASGAVAGDATTIDVPGGQDMPATYEVRELDSLIASGDYSSGSVTANDQYPDDLQPRDYAPGSTEDVKVQSFAQGQKPGYYINTDPSASNGPPTVTANGTVLNGNGRTMSLQLAASRGDMGWYRRELDRLASVFGLDPQSYTAMRQPVLVRVVKVDPTSDAAKRFARQGNVSSTQAQSPARTAASLGNLVDQGVLDTIDIGDDTTFSEAVSGPAGKDFRQALAAALPAQEVPRYLNEQTGGLTEAGKELVRDLLLTKQLPVELVERMREDRKAMLRSLEQAVPQLMRLDGVVPKSRVNEHLTEALEWISRHPEVTLPTQLIDSVDASGKATQQDLTGRDDGMGPEARMLAEWLLGTAQRGKSSKPGLVSLIRGLENRSSPILGDTRSGGQIAADALGVPLAPGADFGMRETAKQTGARMSFRKDDDSGVEVASLAKILKAAMPGAPDAMFLPDGPFGIQVVTKRGKQAVKVRVALPQDFERINAAERRRAAEAGREPDLLTPENINGWAEGGIAYLVTGSATKFTFNHELTHVLVNLGVLTRAEVEKLARLADKVLSPNTVSGIKAAYRGAGSGMMAEEMAAHVIEAMAGKKARPSAVDRVLAWLRDMAAMLKITTQSDYGLAKDVASGRILDKRSAAVDTGNEDAKQSRRIDAPGQQSLFGEQIPAPAPAPKPETQGKPETSAVEAVEKAVEKMADSMSKMMEQQATLFDLLAKAQAKPDAASPTMPNRQNTTGGPTDEPGSAGRDSGDGRAAGRPGGERSGDAGSGNRGAVRGRGRVGGDAQRNDDAGQAERATDAGRAGAVQQGSGDETVADPGVPRDGPFRFRSVEDAMPPRGAITRARTNLDALRAIRSIQAEGRQATAAEREALARFSGWGSLKWIFDPKTANGNDASKATLYNDALALLPEGSDERNRAISSTLNAHYTHPQVVADAWSMVKRGMGDFAGQPMRALEPSAGLGVFVGLEPDGVRGALTWAAVEKEPGTAAMFGAVYPEVATAAMGFEEWAGPDNAFDVAIGNVPFGSIPMFDKRYAAQLGKPNIHDYFFVKSLDKVRPGGLVAFFTSTGTMDKATDEVRKHLYAQADLVHAVRFPADAHDTAGTSVVTDLIILRKRLPGEPKGDRSWLTTGTVKDPLGGEPIPLNMWFKKRPDLVLGRIERSGSLWGVRENGQKNPNVVKEPDYQAKLDAAIRAMPTGVMSAPAQRLSFDMVPAPAAMKNHALVGRDGWVWQNQGGTLVKIKQGAENAERVGWMRSLVANLRQVWAAEQAGSTATSERAILNRTYDGGRAKFGALSDPKNMAVFAADPDAPNLMALEEMKGDPDDENSLTYEKTAIFRQQVVRPPPVVGQAKNATEAVTASMGRIGRVDPRLVADALGVTPAAAVEQMRAEGSAFELPEGGWAPSWNYLQGNVKAKLAEARDAATTDQRFAANVTALEQVQPEPVGADQVSPTLGAPFVPSEVMAAFARSEIGGSVAAVKAGDGRWLVQGYADTQGTAAWQVKGRYKTASPTQVLEVALNRSKPDMDGVDRDKNRLPDPEGARAVLDKAADMRVRFADWIRLPEQADHLAATVQVYNDTVNVYRHGDPDTGWITFAGMIDKYKDDPVRRRSVARALTEGRLMLDHEVGMGKSATMFAVAMEGRRLGIARKPMIATLNAVVPQVAREAMETYPGKNILIQPTAWGDPGTPTGRDTFLSRLATQDYDVAIVSHETLTSIGNDPELMRERHLERIAEIKAAKASAEINAKKSGENNRYVSSLAKMLENEQQKLAELHSHVLKKDHVSFADIGTDMLIVDEAHAHKNLPMITAQEGILGLGGSSSKRSEDLLMKIRALHKLHGAERGVVLATGTPISNTMSEVYAFQHFLQPKALKAHGVNHFDDWCRAFGEPKQVQEVQADGTRKMVTRFAQWVNIHGLSRMLRDVFDVGLARDNPRVRNALPESVEKVVKVPLTKRQRQFREWIAERMAAIKERKGPPKPGDDNILVVLNDAKRASIDMRLVAPGAMDADGSKIPATADGVAELYLRGPKIDGKAPLQFIFHDVQSGTGKSADERTAWGFNLNAALIDALASRGVPRNRIAVVDGSMSKREVAAIKRQASTGRYAVLIGRTDTLGTGTNAQQYAIATWHLDVPARPADIVQRDGRAVRSGNLHKNAGNVVTLHRVVTEGTMDEALWGRVGLKWGFISSVQGAIATPSGAADMREVELDNMDPEMVAAMASGDPDLVRIIDLENELGTLRRAQKAHASQGEYLRSSARHLRQTADSYASGSELLSTWAQTADGKVPDKATLDDGTDSKGLDVALAQFVTAAINGRARVRELGTFAGLPITAVDTSERTTTDAGGAEITVRSAVVEYAGTKTTATSGSAVLGRARMRVKELPQLAKADAEHAAKLRDESDRAEQSASQLGPWPKAADLARLQSEHVQLKARLASKPKIPSTLDAEASAVFASGTSMRQARKAEVEAKKEARKEAKASGAKLSRRLPSSLAGNALVDTPAIRQLVEDAAANVSPEAAAAMEQHQADRRSAVRTGYTVNDLPEQHRAKLGQLYANIREADEALAATADRVARRFGGTVVRGPIKKPERVIAKALPPVEQDGYGGDVSQVMDAFRLSIVVPDINAARQAAAAMEAAYVVPTGSNGKRRLKDRFAKPLPVGYGDILMNVVVNGKVGEVQIHIPEILAVKDLGHDLYAVQRQDGVSEQTQRIMHDEAVRTYAAGWAAYAARGGAGAPVTRATQASQSVADPTLGNDDGPNVAVDGTSSPDAVTTRTPTPGITASTQSDSSSLNVVPDGSVQDQGRSDMTGTSYASSVGTPGSDAMSDVRTDTAAGQTLNQGDGGQAGDMASRYGVSKALLQGLREEAIREDHATGKRLAIRWDPLPLNPGDALPPSRVWEDGNPTDAVMDGTSSIDIQHLLRHYDTKNAAFGRVAEYEGSPYLVRGDFVGKGVDAGEVMLANAEVVRPLERPAERTGGERLFSRRIGRPDLANPGTTGPVRQMMDEVDEARNQAGEPGVKPDEQREAEAEARFAADPDGERRKLMDKYRRGEFTDDVETRIAHHLINRDGLRAITTRSGDEMLAATKIMALYRANGSDMARAFRARMDRMASPEERVNLLTQAILTPPAETLAQVRSLYETGKAQEAEALMRQHAVAATKVLDILKGQGIDPNDLTLPDKLVDPVKMAQALRTISMLRKTRPGDALLEYWINAILSGPYTHVVNTVGNTASAGWELTVQRWAEIAVGMATHADGKARAGELLPMYTAMFRALPKAARNFARSFSAEADTFQWEVEGVPVAGQQSGSKVEDRVAITGVKGRIIRVPTRFLTAADSFFKTLIGHAQATAEAYRSGVSRKLTGPALDQHMASEMADYASGSWHKALGYAQELTFQSNDSGVLKGIQKLRNYETIGGLKPFAFVLPFTRTPWNIMATGIRKTPLGTAALAFRLGREGYRRAFDKDNTEGAYASRDAVRHAAEQTLAWAIMLALAGAVNDRDDKDRPWITGTGEGFAGNRGKRELEGRQTPPLSIRIGDTWYSYGRIEPAATALGMVVDMLEAKRDNDPLMAKTASVLMEQVRSKTFLSGISDLMNALEDPERFGSRYTANFVSSWMPNLVRQPLRATQEVMPEGKPLGQTPGESAVGIWLRAVGRSALPIEALGAPPKIDVWGREIPRTAQLNTSWLARMGESLTWPMPRRLDRATELDLIVKAHNDAFPEEAWWPTTPAAYYKVNGKRVDMTEDQYNAFLRERGQLAAQQLAGMRWSPDMKPSAFHIDMIQKALRRATTVAKAKVLNNAGAQMDEQAKR